MGFFDDIAGIVSEFNSLKEEAVSAVSGLKEEALGLRDEAVSTGQQLKSEALSVKNEFTGSIDGIKRSITGQGGQPQVVDQTDTTADE